MLAAVLAAFVLLGLAAAPAQATGYRYWSYWLRAGGGWTYAQTGPAMHIPRDGDVEGWRFAVSRDAAAEAVQPRGGTEFGVICAGTPAAPGRKRIALVIDPGTTADAPGGATPPRVRTACARVADAASSADALAAVARPLRYDSAGILCAIGGYPAAGCGEQVAADGGDRTAGPASASGGGKGHGPASASGGGQGHGSGPALGVFAGAGAVVVLGGAAVWQARRRRP